MTTRFTKTVAAAFAAALIGLTASPAMAGGQFSIGFAPSDPDQAQALGFGLKMFSLARGFSATGGTIGQNGNNNSCGLFQFGEATDAQCLQNGDSQSGITTVFGF